MPTSSGRYPVALQTILDCLRSRLPEILDGRPGMLAYLYGSVAEGYALPDSDIDIALVLTENHGLSAYERMRLELAIGADVEDRCHLREADVRSIDDAPLMVQGTVLTEGLLLYARDEDFRVEYEVLTRKRYFDFLPVHRQMQRAYLEHMAADFRGKGWLPDG